MAAAALDAYNCHFQGKFIFDNEKGYKIAISARRKERLDEIKKLNPDMVIVKEYDSSTEKNDELIKNLIDKLNGVDLIIYCSGIGIINKELDYSLEKKVNNLNVSELKVITQKTNLK